MDGGAHGQTGQHKGADSPRDVDRRKEIWPPSLVEAVENLIAAANDLRRWESGKIDVITQAGIGAATAFLHTMNEACSRLEVKRQQRGYLDGLPERAASRWRDPRCPYSVHVWAQSMDGVVCLNKKEYPFSRKLKFLSAGLQKTLRDVVRLLKPMRALPAERWGEAGRAQMRLALTAFDRAWTSLEAQFLEELTLIEAEARALAVEASEHLRSMNCVLAMFETGDVDQLDVFKDKDFLLHRDRLVDCVSRLNLAANPRCAGRKFAAATLRRAEEMQEVSLLHPERPESGILAIATEAINGFYALCDYFLGTDAEELDPNLGNNRDLVGLLVTWEASWELAAAYVDDELGLQSLCDLVMFVREAKAAVPALAQMCDEVSPELFVVLPRIVWLRFLNSPSQIGPLIQALVPHRFSGEQRPPESEQGASQPPALWYDEELLAFMEDFKRLWNSLAAAAPAGVATKSVDANTLVSDALIRCAVLGSGAALEGSESAFGGPAGRGAREACGSFMCALEGWSMELQRHRAKEWNRFIAAVLRCVSMEADADVDDIVVARRAATEGAEDGADA